MVLVILLLFTATLLILGGALLNFALTEKLIALYNSSDVEKYYLAEAGLEIGIAILREDFYYQEPVHGSLGRGTYQVTFSDINEELRLITSEALVENDFLRLTLLVRGGPPEGLQIEEWIKP